MLPHGKADRQIKLRNEYNINRKYIYITNECYVRSVIMSSAAVLDLFKL